MKQEQHKVLLTWPGGGRETVLLSAEMTLQELREIAAVRFKCAAAAAVTLCTGFPVLTPLLDNGDNGALVLARSLIPHMTRVSCSAAAVVATTVPQHDTNAKKRSRHNNEQDRVAAPQPPHTKKRAPVAAVAAAKNKNDCVDLTLSSDEDDDEEEQDSGASGAASLALARRLQKEENKQHVVPQQQHQVVPQQQPQRGVKMDTANPTTSAHLGPWIYKNGRTCYGNQQQQQKSQVAAVVASLENDSHVSGGKWLIRRSRSNINATWQKIWRAVVSGEIPSEGCKVSTGSSDTAATSTAGKNSFVICVYTTDSQAHITQVGSKILGVTHDGNILYKTNEMTVNNVASSTKTLWWNSGRPTYTKPSKPLDMSKCNVLLQQATQKMPPLQLTYNFEIVLPCVGMTHNIPRDEQRFQEGVTRVVLRREETSMNHPNVIAVHAETTDRKIGYIRDAKKFGVQFASLIAPWMDATPSGLICVDSATMLVRISDATMNLLVRGRACEDARDILEPL